MADSQFVSDAKALGAEALQDSRTYLEGLLNKLGSDAEGGVVTLGNDAVALGNSFIPAPFLPVVQQMEAGPIAALEADAVSGIKVGVGIAIARVDALLGG